MTRRFRMLLDRATLVRRMIEREQGLAQPSAFRLMRMKTLSLRVSRELQRLAARRIVAMASAPRFVPTLVFSSVHSVPAGSQRW
jgi:adenylate kinase